MAAATAISDEDLLDLTGDIIDESKVESTPVIVSKQDAILETVTNENNEDKVVEIIEEEPEADDGAWGGLTTAFGGWGLGSAAAAAANKEDEPASNAELEDMAQKMEAVAASTTDALSSALWSAVDSATAAIGVDEAGQPPPQQEESSSSEAAVVVVEATTTTGGPPASDAELTNMTSQMESAAVETTEALSSALWSTLDAVNKGVSEMKLPSAGIDEWIDDLEQQEQEKDPHKKLRDSLYSFVQDHPRATYEAWVEHLLVTTEGWDEGSAVVDQTFYYETSIHRNLWNEKNVEDGIGPDDQDITRSYVEAREKPMGTHAFSLTSMKDPDYDEDFVGAVAATGGGGGGLPNNNDHDDDDDEIIFEDLGK